MRIHPPIVRNPRIINIVLRNEERFWRFRELAAPDRQQALADEFGVAQATISKIARGLHRPRKLTPAQAKEITVRWHRGRKYIELSNRFSQRRTARKLGLSTGQISSIVSMYSMLKQRPLPVAKKSSSPVSSFLTRRLVA